MISLKNTTGLNSDCFPTSISDFTQSTINFTACLDKCNLDINEIINESASIEVVSKELVKSPIGTSAEGIILTGQTLMVVVDITVKYQYTSLQDRFSVYNFSYTYSCLVPIVIKENFNDNYDISTTIFFEDLNYSLCGSRKIFNSVTFTTTAEQMIGGC